MEIFPLGNSFPLPCRMECGPQLAGGLVSAERCSEQEVPSPRLGRGAVRDQILQLWKAAAPGDGGDSCGAGPGT